MISFKDYISEKALKRYLKEYFDKKIHSYSYKKIYSEQLQYFHDNQKKILKNIINKILAGQYTTQPALLKTALIEGKKRKIYYLAPQDDFLGFVLQKAFSDVSDIIFHPNLYSYQKGISKIRPVQKFCSYIKHHIKTHPDIKTRGLYVLRRDIKSYGENIPVQPSSQLWKNLEDVFSMGFKRDEFFEPIKKLLFLLANPVVITESNETYSNLYGIADGSSISSILLNIYLSKIDKELSAIYGGFYARYGDDMIFAHNDHERIKRAEERFETITNELGLSFNPKKSMNQYFNGAGRKALDESFLPAQKINYLGNTINFKGNIEIRNDKLNSFLRELKLRVGSTNKVLSADKENKLNICAHLLNDLLNPSNSKYSKYYSELKTLNSRSQIKEIDYKIRLMILKEINGSNSVRLLRKYSFKKLINSNGIQSFKYYINRQI